MNKVCEAKGYYGTIQYGLRSGRSTSDCVFMLLAAIGKAKKKRQVISFAFSDIVCFFADNLVLISRTRRRGIEKILRTVNWFCLVLAGSAVRIYYVL